MCSTVNTSDANDPEVIIKIHISHAFHAVPRALTHYVINGIDYHDYACGQQNEIIIANLNKTRLAQTQRDFFCKRFCNMFGYFHARSHAILNYYTLTGM